MVNRGTLLSNSLLFFLGTVISKVVMFVLIPIYTIYLTKNEFGLIEIIQSTIILVIPVVTLNIAEALFRFSMDKNVEIEKIFSSSILLVTFLIIPLLSIGAIIISRLNLDHHFYLILLLVFLEAYKPSFKNFAKALNRVNDFMKGEVLNSFVLLGSSLLFLIMFEMGLVGLLISMAISVTVELVYYIFHCKFYVFFSFKEFDYLKLQEYLIYSIPIIPNAIMWWVMSLSDRYFLSFFWGLSSVAIYSVANKIPALITIFQGAILSAWKIAAVENSQTSSDSTYFSKGFEVLSGITAVFVSIYLIFNNLIFSSLFPIDYFDAAKYAPWLMIISFTSFYTSYFATMYIVNKQTKPALITTIYGAILNLILSFLMIPFLGIWGAVISTLASYMLVYYLRYLDLKNKYGISLNIMKNVISMFIIALQALIVSLLEGSLGYLYLFLLLILQLLLYKKIILEVLENAKNLMRKNKK